MLSPTPSSEEAWQKLSELWVRATTWDSPERRPVSNACYPDTRMRLLQSLRDTLQQDDRKVAWLSGAAGTGKSSVAHTIAQEFHQRGELAASFFFTRTDNTRNAIDNFIPTISYQLGLLNPRAKDLITKAIVDDPSLLSADESRDTQLDRLVLNPLRSLQPSWRESGKRMLMIIDGLDECIPPIQDRRTEPIGPFMSWVVKALSLEKGSSFHVLITSRPYNDICRAMDSSGTSVQRFDTDDEDLKKDTDRLIMAYLEDMKSSGPLLSFNGPVPFERECELLLQYAPPNFAIVTNLLKALRTRTRRELHDSLQELLKIPGMHSINNLFQGTLVAPEHITTSIILLVSVVAMSEPLSPSHFCRLLANSVNSIIDAARAMCCVPHFFDFSSILPLQGKPDGPDIFGMWNKTVPSQTGSPNFSDPLGLANLLRPYEPCSQQSNFSLLDPLGVRNVVLVPFFASNTRCDSLADQKTSQSGAPPVDSMASGSPAPADGEASSPQKPPKNNSQHGLGFFTSWS